MNHSHWAFLGVLLMFALAHPSLAQQAVLSAGGESTGSSGSVSFSFGQLANASVRTTGGSVNQGVQQPFEFFVVTDIDPIFGDLSITVYPNPTVDQVNLSTEGILPQGFAYHLLDMSGKSLSNGAVTQSLQHIPFGEFPAGTYFLRLQAENKLVTSIKIIKNN